MRLSSGDKLDARLAPVEAAGLGDCSRIVGNTYAGGELF
jgi:hypothetical protein